MINYWNDFLTGSIAAFIVMLLLFPQISKVYFPLGLTKFTGAINPRLSTAFKTKLTFWLIMALAVIVRVWGFGNTPTGFNQDGAMAAVDAKALADYGTDRFGMVWPVHLTAWGYGQMSSLLSYLMVPFIKIGGLNEITARLPILLVSLAGMLALYGFIKNAFGVTAGLIALGLVAINPWHIMQSRWALDCNLFPHFFLIGCYFLHKATVNKNYLYVSMFSFALCMYSYGISFFSVPLFLLVIVIYTLCAKIFRVADVLSAAATYVFFSWPIWAVMVINFMRWPSIETPFFTIPFFPQSVRSGDILFFSTNFSEQLGHNINALLKTVVWQSPDLPWNAIDNYGTQYQFSLPLVLLGLSFLIIRSLCASNKPSENPKEIIYNTCKFTFDKFGAIIILAGVSVGLWIGLVVASVNVNRINLVYYFLIIAAAIGLSWVFYRTKLIFMIIMFFYILFFTLFCNHYFSIWSKQIGGYFFSGMTQALEAAADIDTPRYYITVNSQFQGAKTVSEILTLFKHQIDATYFQGQNFTPDTKRLSAVTVAGNKYGLPYSQRYQYINPSTARISHTEKAVYIVNSKEAAMFEPSNFNITAFEGYYLIVPKILDN